MDAADLAGLIAARARPGETLLVGLTGSVAAGKTTLSDELAIILARDRKVQTLATDGFLLPNSLLAERGLLGRKGFPETYDSAGLVALMKAARQGPVTAPVYSHTIYDVDPARTIAIDRPDILILDGLGLAPIDGDRSVADALDILIYIDADEADLEVWYIDRFVGFWRAAETDPTSFYAQWRAMTEDQVVAFARGVWQGINLPNLRDHILPARDAADIVLLKTSDHSFSLVRGA